MNPDTILKTSKKLTLSLTMADSQDEQVKKLYKSCANAQAELKRYQHQLMEAVDNAESKVRVKRLVKSREEAMTKPFGKHKKLYSFAERTAEPEA